MKIKLRNIIISIVILIFSFVTIFLSREFLANYFVRLNMKPLKAPDYNTRLIVFAPHCDDEVLGAGLLIKKTIESGGKVLVVLMTNGDGFKEAIEFDYINLHPKPSDYVNFGYIRQRETINALKSLGLSGKDIIFLGYPDGGLSYLWNVNWDNNNPYTSRYTQTDKSPYYNSYTKSAIYSGKNVVADIENIIKKFKPNYIVFPHPNDMHPDHWATNCFVKYALTDLKYRASEYLYLVHRGDWPTPPKRDTSLYLVPPAKLTNIETDWYALDLSDDEVNAKDKAIHLYKTQIKVLALLMNGFVRKNELLGIYQNKSLINTRNYDNEIYPNENNRIILDPKQDAIKLQISKDSDIVGLYSEISKEGNLHLFIETDDEISSFVSYNFNIFFFNENIKRMNLLVEGNKLQLKNVSIESILDSRGISLMRKANIVHVIIPKRIVGEFKHMFINATTSIKGHQLDHTAWRMVDNL